MIQDNVNQIQENISSICRKLGRNPQEITLVGVTKFAENDKIEAALAAGIVHIAENRVQEGKRKYPLIKGSGAKIMKHLIGHLQTNKVKDALKIFDLIQSVDSLKLAQEIEKEAAKLGRTFDILVQINTSGEEQKYGLAPADTMTLFDALANFKFIRVLGLMAMAPLTEDQEIVRDSFRKLRMHRDQITEHFKGSNTVEMKYLSMGMSQDFSLALEEGSNMVRIGSAIFK